MGRLRRAHVRLSGRQVQKERRKALRRAALRGGTAAVFAVSAGMLPQGKAFANGGGDAHWLAVAVDSDGDGLADWEEKVLGYDPANTDADGSGTADGVELARRCAEIIDSLPIQQPGDPAPEGIYVTEILTYGLEQCHVCGESFNMGAVTIHDPGTGREETLCFLALHYLEHGSFSFSGTVHEGRVSVPALVRILGIETPNQGDHRVPVAGDSDGDMMSDREEYGLGYRPFESDQNGNAVVDGADLGKRIVARVEELTASAPTPGYEIFRHELDGLEQCHICGQSIHMGGTTIANTRLGLKYPQDEWGFLPDLALHGMSHGSFDYFGTAHVGRVDINLLMRVLELQLPHVPDKHELPLKGTDSDQDQITDAEEIGARLNSQDADQDENLVPDGVDLARQCRRVLDGLPVHETPPPELKGPYKIDRFQRGTERCDVCGESVNMGFWEVHNPTSGLSMQVPDIVCHYMGHGTFEYGGDVHGRGRIDMNKLLMILEMPAACGDLGTLYRAGDVNQDCDVDLGDLAELARQWLTDTHP